MLAQPCYKKMIYMKKVKVEKKKKRENKITHAQLPFQ